MPFHQMPSIGTKRSLMMDKSLSTWFLVKANGGAAKRWITPRCTNGFWMVEEIYEPSSPEQLCLRGTTVSSGPPLTHSLQAEYPHNPPAMR